MVRGLNMNVLVPAALAAMRQPSSEAHIFLRATSVGLGLASSIMWIGSVASPVQNDLVFANILNRRQVLLLTLADSCVARKSGHADMPRGSETAQ